MQKLNKKKKIKNPTKHPKPTTPPWEPISLQLPPPPQENLWGKSPEMGLWLPQYRHSNTRPPTPRPSPAPQRKRSASPPPRRPPLPLTRRGLGRGPGPRSLSSPPEGWVRGSGTPAVGTARGWGYGERVQPGAAAPRRPRFAPPRLFAGTQKEKRWSVGPRPAGRQRPERRGSRSAPGPGQCGDTSVFFLRAPGTKWPPPPRPAPLTLRAARRCANCGPPKHLRLFTELNYALSAPGETPPRAVAGGLRKVRNVLYLEPGPCVRKAEGRSNAIPQSQLRKERSRNPFCRAGNTWAEAHVT